MVIAHGHEICERSRRVAWRGACARGARSHSRRRHSTCMRDMVCCDVGCRNRGDHFRVCGQAARGYAPSTRQGCVSCRSRARAAVSRFKGGPSTSAVKPQPRSHAGPVRGARCGSGRARRSSSPRAHGYSTVRRSRWLLAPGRRARGLHTRSTCMSSRAEGRVSTALGESVTTSTVPSLSSGASPVLTCSNSSARVCSGR